MQIPAYMCKRIAKAGDAPICRTKCSHCPCVGVVRGVYKILGGDPINHLEDGLPSKLVELLQINGERVWSIFLAGGEMEVGAELDDGCGHTQMVFNRPIPEGFLDVDDSQL